MLISQNNERTNNERKTTIRYRHLFTIKYYADKHSKTITRRGQWTKDCLVGTHKVKNYSYIKYFDVDANGIRCASKSWEISEVRT